MSWTFVAPYLGVYVNKHPVFLASSQIQERPLYSVKSTARQRSNQLPGSGQINCLIDTLRGILI
jgi:hypothetical protein